MSNLASSKYPVVTATASKYQWYWQEQPLSIAYETVGIGEPILLLPSFSTVSSRTEMSGLAARLKSQFQVTSIDFPGFGDSARPRLDYAPSLYRQFLADFVRDNYTSSLRIVAAGHAAGYALNLAATVPNIVSKLVLVAPTWRGPLPTMARGQKPWLKGVRELIRTPIMGQFLYQLTTTPSFLEFMYRRHVYSDTSKLTPDLLARKRQLTQHSGARYGAAAFPARGTFNSRCMLPRRRRSIFIDGNWGGTERRRTPFFQELGNLRRRNALEIVERDARFYYDR